MEPCWHGRWISSGHGDGGRGDHDGQGGAARKISEVQKKLDNGEDGCHEEEGQVDVICGVIWSDGEGGDDIHNRVLFLPKPALASSCLQPPWFDFKARKLLEKIPQKSLTTTRRKRRWYWGEKTDFQMGYGIKEKDSDKSLWSQ